MPGYVEVGVFRKKDQAAINPAQVTHVTAVKVQPNDAESYAVFHFVGGNSLSSRMPYEEALQLLSGPPQGSPASLTGGSG